MITIKTQVKVKSNINKLKQVIINSNKTSEKIARTLLRLRKLNNK